MHLSTQGIHQVGQQGAEHARGQNHVGIEFIFVVTGCIHHAIEVGYFFKHPCFGQVKAGLALPTERQLGGQFAFENVLAHLVSGQQMAGKFNHRLVFTARLEHTFAFDAECRWQVVIALGQQPLRHGRLGGGGGLQQGQRQSVQHPDQGRDDFVRFALTRRVGHHQPRVHVEPDHDAALLGKCQRQQGVHNVFADFAGFFFAGFAAGGGFDFLNPLIGFAAHHRAGYGLGFDLQFQNPMTANRLHQGTMRLAARFGPAHRFVLAGAALHKTVSV